MGEVNPIIRNLQKPGRKNAIFAMCAHCTGCTAAAQGNGLTDHLEPGFRRLIAGCTSTGCPLHPWRPYRGDRS